MLCKNTHTFSSSPFKVAGPATTAKLFLAFLCSALILGFSGCAGVVTRSATSTSTPPPTSLAISTSSLPNAQVNTAWTFTVSASGGTAPYSWSVASGSSLPSWLTMNSAGQLSGTPTQSGSVSFTLVVTDSSSTHQSASQTFNLTVAGAGSQVSITTSSLPNGNVGSAYSASFAATGGTAPYTWSVGNTSTWPTWLSINASTGALTGTPNVTSNSSITVQVADSSSPAQTATKTLSFSIAGAIPPLVITTTSLPNGSVGSAYSATLAATGGTSPYSWSIASGALPSGVTLAASTGAITGTPTASGSFSVTMKVTDSGSIQKVTTQAFSFTVSGAGQPLSVASSSLASGTVNAAYSVSLLAAGGTSPYSWSMTSGSLPAGLTMASFGVISGTPTASGSFSITVQVTDSSSTQQKATKSLTLTVAAAPPLVISTSSLPNGQVSVAYSASLAATGGNSPYTWSITSGALPSGLTLTASTGAITGTPTASGSFSITVQVADSGAAQQKTTKSISFTVAVAPPPTLVISTSSLAAGQVGTAYSASLSATGGKSPYTWSIISGALPSGVTLTASTGAISGTPTASGSFSITVQAADSASPQQKASKSLTLTVTSTTPTLSITTSSLPNGQSGTAYSATLSASGGTSPYNWSLSSGSLPTGVSLGSNGQVSGTPTQSGSFSITIQVADSASHTASKTYILTVAAGGPTPLAISTSSLPGGQVGSPYSTVVSATGGTTPYSWSVISGSLPAGLTLSAATGQITGTPSQTGSSSIIIQVRDSSASAQTASQPFSIVINTATAGTPVTACGILSNAGTTYVLQNDVSASRSCFGIQASNITLDLNGHTVTFFTGYNAEYAYGIGAMSCTASYADPSICWNGSISNVTIYNGTITSSTNGDNYGGERGIQFGIMSGSCQNISIHDVTLNIAQAGLTGGAAPIDSRPINLDWCALSGNLYNITANTGYGRASNRQEITGAPFYMFPGTGGGVAGTPYTSTICENVTTSYTPSLEVCDNTLVGGAQGGIGNKQDYYHIHHNHISPNDSATDGFGVWAWGQNGGEVDHNTITSISGRGIQLLGNNGTGPIGVAVHDNNVAVRMLPQYCSDTGQAPCNSCMSYGTFGIEWKYNQNQNDQVYNNTVIAYADQCMATGLRINGFNPGGVDHDNTYTAVLSGTKCVGSGMNPCIANAMSLDLGGDGGTGATIVNDTFTGDDDQVYVDYGSLYGALFQHCTFIKPATASAGHIFLRFGSFQSVSSTMHFQDSIFVGGEDPNSNNMSAINGNHPFSEYYIDWTYTLTVQNASGNPLPGAAVAIVDANSNSVFAGTTDSNGQISTPLNQVHWYSTASNVVQQVNTPHAITVTAVGCSVASSPISTSITQTTSQTVVCH